MTQSSNPNQKRPVPNRTESNRPHQNRKDSHLGICLEDQVEFPFNQGEGFSAFRFEHDALPEISKAEISLETGFLGKKLAAPLLIGAMTGGTEKAAEFNRRLALAAEKCGIGLALGSQRPMLENQEVRISYAVREWAPSLPILIGNLGAVQLNYGVGTSEIQRLVSEVGADAFYFHLNPLQEAIQPEGNTNFSGLLNRLAQAVPQISVPVLIKEVGAGISEVTARKLATLLIAGVETAGAGGTSWSKIESLRTVDPIQRSTGELFARWGVPTPESIQICRRVLKSDQLVIASGGIRNGLDAAKAIALGADGVAISLPMLKAAEKSVDAVVEAISRVQEELRTAMFLTGCRTISDLKKQRLKSVCNSECER